MPSIDYEVEYDNRARVPEHPAIFGRWEQDAAKYREQTSAAGRAELDLSYGPSERQIIDLFRPEQDAGHVALFIHGGYWRALQPSTFSHIARGLNAHGVTVGVAGYDLCPKVSVADIIGQLRAATLFMWKRFRKRIFVYGHSAGGHLAGAMLATDWATFDSGAPADLVPAAMSISGVFDLTPLLQASMNADLRLDQAQARAVSPVFWPAPAGRVFDSLVGGIESSEFIRQAEIIVDAWKDKCETRFEIIPGANHFTALDPLSDPRSAMTARTLELCRRT
ncbi:MAG TPA: alpha/beta hydrolase [Pseudorhodoplanes sp.]|nr:alpha/beta hydrolase [Pseudorhodoplanes sp.]